MENALPVEIEDVRLDLRIDSTDEDATLRRMIQAAAAFLEIRTGYVLVPGTYHAILAAWPTDPIEIMRGPVRSVDRISYREDAATWTDVDLGDFQVSGRKRSFLLAPFTTFVAPTIFTCMDGVQVEFTAGFAATEDGIVSEGESAAVRPVELDAGLKTLLIMLVGEYYKNRELDFAKVEMGFPAMLHAYRQLW